MESVTVCVVSGTLDSVSVWVDPSVDSVSVVVFVDSVSEAVVPVELVSVAVE